MILLTLTDVLAVAARVVACHSSSIVDNTDLDEVELTLVETKEAAGTGNLADVAAVLLAGLVRRRPFTGPNRRIALTVTLQFLALNDRDLDLEPVEDMDLLLDRFAAGASPRDIARALSMRLSRRGERHSTPPVDRPLPTTTEPLISTEKELAMFERFTDRARRATVLAQEEARTLGHDYIGTEHILLGLISEGEGVAAKALGELKISLAAVRTQVEEIIGRGVQEPIGHIPFTPRAKKVLELSLREAMQLGVNYIGTEHVLLGLIREGEGVAAQALERLGADLDRTRQKVVEVLARSGPEATSARAAQEGRSARVALILQELNAEFDDAARLRTANDRLVTEVARLRGVLREHGIDPDADGGEATAHAS
jgi:prophage maintenance system killer protein